MRRICQSGDAAQGSRRLLPDSSVRERKLERTVGIIQREESGGDLLLSAADQRFGFKDGSSIISTLHTHYAPHKPHSTHTTPHTTLYTYDHHTHHEPPIAKTHISWKLDTKISQRLKKESSLFFWCPIRLFHVELAVSEHDMANCLPRIKHFIWSQMVKASERRR